MPTPVKNCRAQFVRLISLKRNKDAARLPCVGFATRTHARAHEPPFARETSRRRQSSDTTFQFRLRQTRYAPNARHANDVNAMMRSTAARRANSQQVVVADPLQLVHSRIKETVQMRALSATERERRMCARASLRCATYVSRTVGWPLAFLASHIGSVESSPRDKPPKANSTTVNAPSHIFLD